MASQKNTQTKTKTPTDSMKKNEKQEKPMTPKQAVTKATSLLRGIDNSTGIIKKHQEVIDRSIEQVKSIVAGIGNQSVAPAPTVNAKPSAKPVVAKKSAKPAKPASAKKASGPKAAPKAAQKPVAKPAQAQSQGPTIKDAAIAVLKENGGVMKASEIWHKAQEKFSRTWSRQVLYNAFDKNPDIFVQTGDGYKYGGVAKQAQATGMKREDKDVDSFIERASKNEAVSSVL